MMSKQSDHHDLHLGYFKERSQYRYNLIEEDYGREVVKYISKFSDMADPGTEVLSTDETFNLKLMNDKILHTLINLKRINDIEKPNEFFSLANIKLLDEGYFIGCFESLTSRQKRIFNKYPKVISYPYYFLDFVLKRIFPKIKYTKKIYAILTRGENRSMSMTETFGRLHACGFEIIDYTDIGYLVYFVCKKVKPPINIETENCGFIIKLERVGKGGKLFDVYKFRTMHPYAEYLQEYAYNKYGLKSGDKIVNDFRVASWGRFLRRLWIDEQPMWINLLKGDVKLVGVRPLSAHKLSVYPEPLRKRRLNYKPGLIPPFYVDLPKTDEEFYQCEIKYLDLYDKRPLLTDFKYFFTALFNIIFKKARSA